MVEDLIYADALTRAVESTTTLEELTYVAAFACSVYAQMSSNTRMTKPFNPMLGETYECDRRAESGWRCLLEQVYICMQIYVPMCVFTHIYMYTYMHSQVQSKRA